MYTELLKWVALIELPIFAALFKMTIRHKKDYEQELAKCKEALAEFKLHAARNYVSVNQLKDVENRLTDHLIRIEKKLDHKGDRR